jgi:hypothetical protein
MCVMFVSYNGVSVCVGRGRYFNKRAGVVLEQGRLDNTGQPGRRARV